MDFQLGIDSKASIISVDIRASKVNAKVEEVNMCKPSEAAHIIFSFLQIFFFSPNLFFSNLLWSPKEYENKDKDTNFWTQKFLPLFTVESHSLFVAVAEGEVNIVIIVMLLDTWDAGLQKLKSKIFVRIFENSIWGLEKKFGKNSIEFLKLNTLL